MGAKREVTRIVCGIPGTTFDKLPFAEKFKLRFYYDYDKLMLRMPRYYQQAAYLLQIEEHNERVLAEEEGGGK